MGDELNVSIRWAAVTSGAGEIYYVLQVRSPGARGLRECRDKTWKLSRPQERVENWSL